MKHSRLLFLSLALLTAVVFATGAPALQAQDNGDVAVPSAAVTPALSYQGVLTENGAAVTGQRTLVFRFFTDTTCTAQAGNDMSKVVTVTDGLFNTTLDVDTALFNGQMLYIQAEVNNETLGCTPLLPAPYALNLVPGAELDSDAVTSIFRAINQNTTARTRGLYGRVTSTVDDSVGVYGQAAGATGETSGVWGRADSPDGYGVYGVNTATDKTANGGAGVYATAVYTGADYQVYGVLSEVNAPNGRAIQARNDATSGQARAVYGRTASVSDDAQAIYGHAAGASGETSGLYGRADSPDGYGVYGINTATDKTANGGAGVYATAVYTGADYQVYGVLSEVNAPNGRAIQARNDATSGQARAVYGRTASVSDDAQAIYGHAAGASGETSGLYGRADSPDGYGVYGINTASGSAGYFEGNVEVDGSVVLLVEDPNDAGTQLEYPAVASNEGVTVFTGTVTLDGTGTATVTLPAETSDLFTTFTYQVTPLAAATTVPYISTKFTPATDAFAITGDANLEVSYTVYAKP